MLVAELSRNTDFVASLTPYVPFVWTGYTLRYEIESDWTDYDSLVMNPTGKRANVSGVTRDVTNEYLKQDTLNDCISQERSYFFDRANQQVYIHTEHSYNPIVSRYRYLFAFGLNDEVFLYIDDFEYYPLITDYPDMEQSSDIVGSPEPTGMTGDLALNNQEVINTETGLKEGVLDFLLTESVYGNDVRFYDYTNNVLSAIMIAKVEDIEIGINKVTLALQDKRIEN